MQFFFGSMTHAHVTWLILTWNDIIWMKSMMKILDSPEVVFLIRGGGKMIEGDCTGKIMRMRRNRIIGFQFCLLLLLLLVEIWCGGVCCSLIESVAVCCSLLQSVAVCCSLLQSVAVCCRVMPCVWRLLQSVAVCCSILCRASCTHNHGSFHLVIGILVHMQMKRDLVLYMWKETYVYEKRPITVFVKRDWDLWKDAWTLYVKRDLYMCEQT